MRVKIRPAGEKQDFAGLESLAELAQELGEPPMPEPMGAGKKRVSFVAEVSQGGEASLAGVVRAEVKGCDGAINALFVHPEHRGNGIEEALLARALKEMDSLGVENRSAKARAHQFALFSKFGFDYSPL